MSLLPIFFNSNILSNLLYDPFIMIDSMDDLVSIIDKMNITPYANKDYLTWQLLEQSSDSRYKKVFERLLNEIPNQYQDLYEGKAIIIGYGSDFEILTKNNPQLKLHISREAILQLFNCLSLRQRH